MFGVHGEKSEWQAYRQWNSAYFYANRTCDNFIVRNYFCLAKIGFEVRVGQVACGIGTFLDKTIVVFIFFNQVSMQVTFVLLGDNILYQSFFVSKL